MRLVLDTNVVVAAMRNPLGASAILLGLARTGRLQLLASTALCVEYEAVCSRPEHRLAARASPGEIAMFLDAVVDLVEPVYVWFLWRPQLRDPGDEMVLEAAANGRADAIATFNSRDFGPAQDRFGISVLTPRDVLERIAP